MKEGVLSKCEKQFVLDALKQNLRVDCRKHNEYRRLTITYGDTWGSCLVTLGNTKVLGEIFCDIDQPKPSRPNEGLLFINVELSPMAAAHFETGRQSELGVRVGRLMERCFKDSRCVDLEALCIVAEEKVWALHLDLRVLNHDGNLVDACGIAALASLAHFRRPDVTLTGQEVTVHPLEERDPIPLSLHHQPVAVSFAVFGNGEHVVLDPTAIEERVAEASLVFGINGYKELCTLQLGGASLPSAEVVLRYAELAAQRANQSIKEVRKVLTADLDDRAAGRPVGFAASVRHDRSTSGKLDFAGVMFDTPVEDSKDVEAEGSDEEEDKPERDRIEEDIVVPLANGTAELLHRPSDLIKATETDVPVKTESETYSVGEGGPSKWIVEDTSDSDIEMMEQEPVEVKQSIEEVDLADSEEEETVTLESGDFKNRTKNEKKQSSTTRGWYPNKW